MAPGRPASGVVVCRVEMGCVGAMELLLVPAGAWGAPQEFLEQEEQIATLTEQLRFHEQLVAVCPEDNGGHCSRAAPHLLGRRPAAALLSLSLTFSYHPPKNKAG